MSGLNLNKRSFAKRPTAKHAQYIGLIMDSFWTLVHGWERETQSYTEADLDLETFFYYKNTGETEYINKECYLVRFELIKEVNGNKRMD